jgi:hypothetical protein
MNQILIVQFQGGLGNQLFQYAALLTSQKMLNSGAKLYSITAPNKHNRLNHNYGKDLFPEVNELNNMVLNDISNYSQTNAFERWNPSFLPSTSTLILSGYFQYFPAIADIVPYLQKTIPSRLLKACPSPRILPNGAQSAFLHVRRGDYLNHPTYHWAQDMEYYEKGVQYVQKKNPYIYKWYIFSDDIAWCRKQALFLGKSFEFVEEEDEYQALLLMTQCHGGAVIANSTFSWWGAILGAHFSKSPIVYPMKWCGEENINLFPYGWHGF